MNRLLVLLLCLSLAGCASAPPPGAPKLLYQGISLSGSEWAEKELPGVLGKNFDVPKVESVDYFKAKGLNLIRYPFRWERLQPTLNGDFDAAELARLRGFVDGALARGMTVLIDPHNYAEYRGRKIGAPQVPVKAFADFWRRLALEYRGHPRVIYGLVNEPHDMRTEAWVDAAQAAVDAIRVTGANNLITLPGNGWSGPHSWFQDWYGTPNAQVMLRVRDPLKNMIFEVHQYFDADYSGTKPECVPGHGAKQLREFSSWLRKSGQKALLGEFGSGHNPVCEAAVRSALQHLEANADVWVGWAWWAGGIWRQHKADSEMVLEPRADGSDMPQWVWLADFIPKRRSGTP